MSRALFTGKLCSRPVEIDYSEYGRKYKPDYISDFPVNKVCNKRAVKLISEAGFSRIPVCPLVLEEFFSVPVKKVLNNNF